MKHKRNPLVFSVKKTIKSDIEQLINGAGFRAAEITQ
jgi:hypothetical protein